MRISAKKSRGNFLQFFMIICFSSGFLVFGYDQGVFSGIIETPYFLEQFDRPSSGQLGIVNAIFAIGGAIGSIICIIFGNLLGRKKAVILGALCGSVGSVIQATVTTIAQLLVGRIIGGIGVGMLTSTVGIWQAEMSPAHNRGALMSIELIFCAAGLLISQWENYGLGTNDSKLSFVFPILFQLVFFGITMILAPFIPESPRWLVSRGRLVSAAQSLARLESAMTYPDDVKITEKLEEMDEICKLEDLSGLAWVSSLCRGGPTQNGKRVAMSCAVGAFQQLCGVNSVTYYIPSLSINFIGVSRSNALWISGLTSVISLVFAVVPIFTIDKIGRLRMLIVGSIGQAICFFVVAGLYAHLPSSGMATSRPYGIGIISFIFIFFGIFSACWMGPSWMYASEILPLTGRSNGMGLTVAITWLCNFLIVMITPVALANITWRYYIILGVFNVLFIPCLWSFTETKGQSLEQLDISFAKRYREDRELRQIKSEFNKK
ncbi:general substrate transporter [Dipodascopsis uninucleata]